MPLQFTGLGSLMNAHGTDQPITRFGDLRQADRRIVDLLFFHLLEQGIYIARRGFIAMHLEIREEQVARLIKSLDDFCKCYGQAIRSISSLNV